MSNKLFCYLSLAALPCLAATLTVSNIEVNQAIQTTTNSLGLVAGRATAVRATLTVSGSASPVAGVSGRLHVFVSGAEITPLAGLLPINAPFTAPLAPNRANQNDTLNFEMPAPSGIPASAAVTFRVDPTVGAGDTGVPLTTPNLAFVNRTAPLLFFTRINYTPAGLGLPDLTTVQPGRGDAMVRGLIPVDESTPTLYREGLFPTLNYAGDSNGDGRLEALGADGNGLISLLASCRQLIVNSGVGASDRVFLYGWLAGNPINGNGLGQVGGRNAFGNTEPIRYQRSYAHELTHNFGFDHNPAPTPIIEVGWDTGSRLPANPATNNTTGRVKPGTLFDIMDAGLLTNQAWIHPNQSGACGAASCVSYQQLLSSPTLASPDSAGDFATDVVVIQGIFDTSGERLLQLKPAFRYPWRSQPTQIRREQQVPLRYSARVVTAAGAQIAIPFNPYVADDASKGAAVPGFFEVMVPASGPIRSIAITDLGGGRSFGAIEGGQQAPRIEIISPADGATLARETRVVARLLTPASSNVMYQAAFSPDGGRTFVPIAVDLQEPTFSFDASAVQATSGQGLIRLFVSDGVSTAFSDVTRLTTPPLTINSVLNAANYKGYVVSPGEIVTIFGLGLGPVTGETLKLTPAGLVDTVLAKTRVLFDGRPGPMIYSSDRQVSAVVPYGITGKSSIQIQVEFDGGKSNVLTAGVEPAVPGIFTQNASGTGAGAILNQDLTVNTPANAAARGSIVAVYATGEGTTNPAGVDGQPGTVPLPTPTLAVTATVDGQPADVVFAGGAPTLVAGVLQVNLRIPASAAAGPSVPIRIQVGGVPSQTGVTVAVK